MTSDRIAAFVTLSLVLAALTGCAVEPADDAPVGSAVEAALSTNALSTNALSSQRASTNALSTNALSTNALGSNALNALQDPGPNGDLFRQLVKYTVGCALTTSQSFSYSYTDSTGTVQNVTDPGSLGIYPQWATQPLTDVGKQQDISACLAARTNHFGIMVHISVRGEQNALVDVSPAEIAAYPYVEGAFWGNLFGSNPNLNSCYNPANVAQANADLRVCASGYLDANGNLDPVWDDHPHRLLRRPVQRPRRDRPVLPWVRHSRSHSITIGLQ